MKSQQQPEPRLGEFEGPTPEEAVRLARQALGENAPVRCWRTRTGGMFGFFARESYVAGIEPPSRDTPKPGKPPVTNDFAEALDLLMPEESTSSPRLSVEQLVEDLEDEVSLESLAVPRSTTIPDTVFIDVLAEAEAAISSSEASNNTEDETVRVADSHGPEWIPELRTSLSNLGVPEDFLPSPTESSLDGLVRSLNRLPASPPIPRRRGAVVVVVGDARDARLPAAQIAKTLGLASTDVLVAEQTAEGRRRISRRRSAKRTTVLIVEASIKSRDLSETASWLKALRPDRVTGAVPARAKRSDVERWRSKIGRVDALALSALGTTATPGELMGALPIEQLDGHPATTLRWMSVLLAMMPDGHR